MKARHGLGWATLLAIGISPLARAENIDPTSNGSQYAWAENVGWINAEPSGNGGPGVQVSDFELTGRMWAENVGWVSLSCKNAASCASVAYGVFNDGHGVLSGYAWSENTGWINFAPTGAGVLIDPANGNFSGRAWGENVGWITFASNGANPYVVRTAWSCGSPAAPTGSPNLSVAKVGNEADLSWTAVDGTGYDVVWGALETLRSSGSLGPSVQGCLAHHSTFTTAAHGVTPPLGGGFWYLVRAVNCGGAGSYGSTTRDQQIALSSSACP
jgi:hypothetical protein